MSNPEKNFERFWQSFHQNYAHFEARHVDWLAQYAQYRPRVTAQTTPEQLLGILHSMVAPLKDGHVNISPTGDLPASAKYSAFSREFPTKKSIEQLRAVTFQTLEENGFGAFTRFRSEKYQIGGYAHSKEYGYLQLAGFGGMSLPEFEAQLEEMAQDFQDTKALIIDIRVNGGGSPAFVHAVAGRLIDHPWLIGYGQSKTGPAKDDFTPLHSYYLYPRGKKALVKPIILLTSGASISAADHFAMYLKELPYVKIVGENTNGIFSSMLGKKLPNGWEYSLSNERTLSAKKVCYEAVGVPVDVWVANTQQDIKNGQDPVLLKALAVLSTETEQLALAAIHYEQKALNFLLDSLLANDEKYAKATLYFNGKVEADATLISPFARVGCNYFQAVNNPWQERLKRENQADSSFFHQNVKSISYLNVSQPVKRKMPFLFKPRNAHRILISSHIAIGDRRYTRIDFPNGNFKGEALLLVSDMKGVIVNYCSLNYDLGQYVLNYQQ